MPAGRTLRDRTHRDLLQARVEVPAVVRLLDLPRGARVLEVGCGRGNALGPLARLLRPSRLVGIDIDATLLAQAEPPEGAELVRGDLRHLPFADATFDVAVDFGTVFHVEEPAAALREIARTLAPGGLFVHETPLAQLLAHPRRRRPALPWSEVPQLRRDRGTPLWASRRNAAEPRPRSLSFRN